MIPEKTLCLLKEKMIAAVFPAGVFILTASEGQLLSIICWMVVIDTLLGSTVAIKNQRFCSSKFSRVIRKICLYFTTMLVALLVSRLQLPFVEFFFNYVGAFIVINEAFSCFEKIGILGFPLPKALLKKLNKDFAKWCEGDLSSADKVLDRRSKS